jgi:peptide/nickel transport system permease protein
MRVVDILMAFPGILLAIAMVSVLGPDLNHVILALCLIGWVGYARLVRGQVLYLRELEYVTAAQALGAKPGRIILWHLVPNLIAPVIVEATFGMAGAILAEASLSFLGLGAQPPTPSWGAMLNEGREFLLLAPHHTTFPGLAIMVVVLGFNFLGDGLRDYFDVKRT